MQMEIESFPRGRKDMVERERRKLVLALDELGKERMEKRRRLEMHYDELLDALMMEKVARMEEMEEEVRERQEKLEREAKVKVDGLNLRNEQLFLEEPENDWDNRPLDPITGLHLLSPQQESPAMDDLDPLGCDVIFEQSVIMEAFLKEVEQEADEDEIVDEKAGTLLPLAPSCPVCFEPMSPPVRIFQCGGGHLICGQCKPRIQVESSSSCKFTKYMGNIFDNCDITLNVNFSNNVA